MPPGRLVMFVEGDGDCAAAPKLIERIIALQGSGGSMLVDHQPFRVGAVGSLIKDDYVKLKRHLEAARRTRANLTAVLILLDGDSKLRIPLSPSAHPTSFCAAEYARALGAAGAGTVFSLTTVFARQEFESWLIAGADALYAASPPVVGIEFRSGTALPVGDLEQSPRDAKGWLRTHLRSGYSETIDQVRLTDEIDLALVSQRMRSFRRLESAITQLTGAIVSGQHIVNP